MVGILADVFLVGGWTNPFEKCARQIGSFPQVGVQRTNLSNHQLVLGRNMSWINFFVPGTIWDPHPPHPGSGLSFYVHFLGACTGNLQHSTFMNAMSLHPGVLHIWKCCKHFECRLLSRYMMTSTSIHIHKIFHKNSMMRNQTKKPFP